MPKKKDPFELALDRILRAVDSLPDVQRRLDALSIARRFVERANGMTTPPKPRAPRKTAAVVDVVVPAPAEGQS